MSDEITSFSEKKTTRSTLKAVLSMSRVLRRSRDMGITFKEACAELGISYVLFSSWTRQSIGRQVLDQFREREISETVAYIAGRMKDVAVRQVEIAAGKGHLDKDSVASAHWCLSYLEKFGDSGAQLSGIGGFKAAFNFEPIRTLAVTVNIGEKAPDIIIDAKAQEKDTDASD